MLKIWTEEFLNVSLNLLNKIIMYNTNNTYIILLYWYLL